MPHASLLLFNDSEIADRERRQHFEQRGVRFLTGADRFAELAALPAGHHEPGF